VALGHCTFEELAMGPEIASRQPRVGGQRLQRCARALHLAVDGGRQRG
jgi:hypothetical protein